jgi:hypothetical protein
MATVGANGDGVGSGVATGGETIPGTGVVSGTQGTTGPAMAAEDGSNGETQPATRSTDGSDDITEQPGEESTPNAEETPSDGFDSDPASQPSTQDDATAEEPAEDSESAANCGISIDSYDLSEEIGTVGIVSWSASSTIDDAEIRFGLSGRDPDMVAPVDLEARGYRTHLLGMKGSTEYDFQVVANGATCTSEVVTLETGPVANDVPIVDRQIFDEGAISPGFIMTLAYGEGARAFIFDKDGDPVWWATAPNSASAARLDFQSKYVWMVTGNPFGGMGSGEVWRVSIDGTDTQAVPGTSESHHDLAPLPDGKVAILLHGDVCSEVAEVGPDLDVQVTIDLSSAYNAQSCHANSILYHPGDGTYTISDRMANLYVKVDRSDGTLRWQFGGSNPVGDHIPGTWSVNHGHHVLDNGNFLFFNNEGVGGGGGGSPVHEYELDVEALTATEVFSYTSAAGNSTSSLGDVQRLPNGNTLITYSNEGIIHEVDSSGKLVQVLTVSGALGYAMHRESLYGPPPK